MPTRKNNIPNNEQRISKIKTKMEAYATPVVVYGYYATQAEACKKLGCSPAELNKASYRNGLVHGLKVVKGEGVTTALTLISKFENKPQ